MAQNVAPHDFLMFFLAQIDLASSFIQMLQVINSKKGKKDKIDERKLMNDFLKLV